MPVKLIPIKPRRDVRINITRVEREMGMALDHVANIIQDDFQATVRTWQRRPRFRKFGPAMILSRLLVEISTDDEIYAYVELGTRPHVIRPRTARMLRFRTRYRAKTRRGVVGSKAGGASGPFRSARMVMHPGTEGRRFAETIAERRHRNLETLVRLALRRTILAAIGA